MAKLSPEQVEFLENPFVGVVTTVRPDGSPHSTVVWVDVLEDGTPSFNTARKRAKEVNLERDPRLSLVVVDPQNAYRWLGVEGRARLTEENADEQIDGLAKKYLDADSYPNRTASEVRVSVRIDVERIEARGL